MVSKIDQILKYAYKFESESLKKIIAQLNVDSFLKELDSLDTFKDKKEYVEKNLERISSGSSRIVYWLPDKTQVFKLAANEKGIAQNHAEASITEKSKYVNPVLNSCPDGSWVIAPAVDKITEKEFEEVTGISFEEFSDVIKYSLKELSSKKRTKPENYEKIAEKNIIKELSQIAKKYKLIPGDLARISSYGLKDNYPVLIDTGLNREIYDKYYSKNK